MQIERLIERNDLTEQKRLNKAYKLFSKILSELQKKELSEEMISYINEYVSKINGIDESDPTLRKALRRSQSDILKKVEKELKIVTKNHYRTLWMSIGLAAFGIPLGAALGSTTGNMGMIGTGIPLGIVIGLLIGIRLDNKAIKEGKQLDIEVY